MPIYSTVTFPGGTTTTGNGEAGARFWNTSGEIVTITRVAKWMVAGNNKVHAMRVYSDYYELLATTSIDMAGQTPGTFVWGTLNTPVNVPVGQRVYILWQDTTGTDRYHYNIQVPPQVAICEDIGNIEGGYYNPAITSLTTNGGLGTSWGPVTFEYTAPLRTWTKSGTVYTTDGTYYQLKSAINHASPGDTVMIPAGTFTWGEGGTQLAIHKAITVSGAGLGSTVVDMHPTATTGFTQTLISLGTGATLRNMSFIGGAARASLLSTGTSTGWRVTNVLFAQQLGYAGYFLFGQYTPNGLIDNCLITGGSGTSELIFTRGRMDSWDTPHSMGGADNIFIEDCVFNGSGYVNDANSNARHVIRNCTINGQIKIDGHGVWTNGGPQRGFRHIEAYRNTWTNTSGSWAAMEIRGGGGRLWGNTAAAGVGPGANPAHWFITDYKAFNNNGAESPLFFTPAQYPFRDQIGRGMYATPGSHTTATSEPMYMWGNRRGGVQWPWSYKVISAGAIAQYGSSYGWEDLIRADRDYFNEVSGFDGSTGVGMGTRAQMDAITPTKNGVGFWVTNEGSWDTTLAPNTSGQLYIWNGSAWVLDYVPYFYPHPLRGTVAAPTIITSTSNQTVEEGATVVQSVSASGNPAPTYQWRKGGSNISGATSSTLTLTSVDSGDAGSYDCVVTNSEGFATSTAAVLTIIPATDSTPPTPNPATIASATAVSATQIDVVATTAIDVVSPDVQYNHAIDGIWQGWQSSPLRYFTELEPDTTYAFLVQSRDGSLNATEQSAPANATTHSRGGANPLLWRGPASITLGVF